MSMREYRFLRAELAELDGLLAMAPEDAIIDRMTLDSRRAEVAESLEAYRDPPRFPLSARLTFNGEPVVAGRGIAAEFGGKAVDSFADAVASVGASLSGDLSERGPLPNRENYRMLITGTALGSFGFEMEEGFQSEDTRIADDVPEASPLEQAMRQVKTILESSIVSEDALSEAITDTAPRALGYLRGFLEMVAVNRAVFSLQVEDDVFRFSDVSQVRRSLSRMSQDNIHEKYEEMFGSLLGYLPSSRRAEILNAETGAVIAAKFDMALNDSDAIRGILDQETRFVVRVRRVGGARPRYTVIGCAALYEETARQL